VATPFLSALKNTRAALAAWALFLLAAPCAPAQSPTPQPPAETDYQALLDAATAQGFAGFSQQQPATAPINFSTHTGPLRIGIIGLVHGHVEGLLWQASQRSDITIVGIAEPNRALFDRLAAKYKLDASLYHADTAAMLDAAKPEAVSVMTSIADHLAAVEALITSWRGQGEVSLPGGVKVARISGRLSLLARPN
jgi:hypothetical protein